jgi:hypothetical protein
MKLASESGMKCAGSVVVVARTYSGSDGRRVTIARVEGPPTTVLADAPAERLQASTIAGRPSVIQQPVVANHGTLVYMRDDTSYWVVNGIGLPASEVIKVAEGAR